MQLMISLRSLKGTGELSRNRILVILLGSNRTFGRTCALRPLGDDIRIWGDGKIMQQQDCLVKLLDYFWVLLDVAIGSVSSKAVPF